AVRVAARETAAAPRDALTSSVTVSASIEPRSLSCFSASTLDFRCTASRVWIASWRTSKTGRGSDARRVASVVICVALSCALIVAAPCQLHVVSPGTAYRLHCLLGSPLRWAWQRSFGIAMRWRLGTVDSLPGDGYHRRTALCGRPGLNLARWCGSGRRVSAGGRPVARQP